MAGIKSSYRGRFGEQSCTARPDQGTNQRLIVLLRKMRHIHDIEIALFTFPPR